jgi:rhamnose utilization protein RhaD (predicted bifunctional aldolase and dehydrogenase)/NAD(P)-dependent dehydrogenase (short-subunit alcohol dehydrogenase family)
VESHWNDLAAPAADDSIAECVHATRLIGADPGLVLHGGGNSSVKASVVDITGRTVPALHVKGSGWDMATIEAAGLTALRLDRLDELLGLDELSDPDMMRELAAARLDPTAPNPSVETLLHALLPHPAVQHSHADVIVNLTNLADGDAVVREVFGDDVVVVPYVMPGFDLARHVRQQWPADSHGGTIGMVLLHHGLFTFGETSRQAYERHVTLISRAERWLDEHAPKASGAAAADGADPGVSLPAAAKVMIELAELRRTLSDVAGGPMIVQRHTDPAVAGFVDRPDLGSLATRGPLTPDHVIRTKRAPLVGRDVEAFAAAEHAYVAANRHRARTELTELDPAPRVVLDPEWGMLVAGRTVGDAVIASDIYHHTIPVLERAEDRLGGYVALPDGDLFDMEYWALEQAKLRRGSGRPPFAGRVGLVTGAASGIGRACAAALLDRGACVAGLDRSPDVTGTFDGAAWLGVATDVTEPAAQRDALAATVERFGGVDVVVVAAGVFGPSRPIADLDPSEWRSVMAVNVDAVADLLSAVHPLLVRSPVGGRVVVIGSKNVAAPGMGAAAYSASKAALNQLTRIAALEWAADGIRVNTVHPDAVFDTALWSPELIAERAARYGMTVDEYKQRNLLHAEVTSAAVADVVAELAGDAFSVTTGAQIPIDGGNDRVI